MTHRGPFQPLLFCDSVILHTANSVGYQVSPHLAYLFSLPL